MQPAQFRGPIETALIDSFVGLLAVPNDSAAVSPHFFEAAYTASNTHERAGARDRVSAWRAARGSRRLLSPLARARDHSASYVAGAGHGSPLRRRAFRSSHAPLGRGRPLALQLDAEMGAIRHDMAAGMNGVPDASPLTFACILRRPLRSSDAVRRSETTTRSAVRAILSVRNRDARTTAPARSSLASTARNPPPVPSRPRCT